jgi:putative transposase
MLFQTDHLFHIYNQGNNRQKIFFSLNNYMFFLKKIETYILPFGDLLAWCLMPNHFHLMVYVHTEAQVRRNGKLRSLNDSIGIMLRSYTRAINKELSRTGSLFREETKAACLTEPKTIKTAWYNNGSMRQIIIDNPDLEYPNICYNYILQNPVRAGLAQSLKDWKFSSIHEFANGKPAILVNSLRIEEFGLKLLHLDGVTQSHPVRKRRKKNQLA